MKIAPLIYASILFLLIRLVNDVPMGHNYFTHSPEFIAIELMGLIGGCYLYFFAANRWIRICADRNILIALEYLVVVIFAVTLPVMIMIVSHETPFYDYLPEIVIPVTITLLMSLLLYTILKYSYQKLREKEAQNENVKTELRLLRSLYHPHFLFNMLNTIYFSIDENNTKARNTIEQMADFMRMQLYEDDEPIPIEREILALKSYIELCRTRYGDSVEVSASIDARYPQDRIHPYLLLPIVENAFKHSGGTPKRIHISLMRSPGIVDFKVENTLPEMKHDKIMPDASGIGLKALRRRLVLLYPGRYDFEERSDSGLYSTHLLIRL